jgi:hypothetical protein
VAGLAEAVAVATAGRAAVTVAVAAAAGRATTAAAAGRATTTAAGRAEAVAIARLDCSALTGGRGADKGALFSWKTLREQHAHTAHLFLLSTLIFRLRILRSSRPHGCTIGCTRMLVQQQSIQRSSDTCLCNTSPCNTCLCISNTWHKAT